MSKNREKIPFLLLLAAVAVSVPLVLGFLGAAHPALDALSHLRIHLAVLMAVLALPLLFSKMRREGAMLLLLAVMAFTTTQGFMDSSADTKPGADSGPRYSIVQINLRDDHPEPKRILHMIAVEKPDIIAYQEASEPWVQWLTILQAAYPYRLDCRADPQSRGVGILSRRPFSEGEKPICIDGGFAAIAPVNLGGTRTNVVALHLSPPWPYTQAYQIDVLEPALQSLEGPTVIAGDFNAAPWSNAVRRVEAASRTAPAGRTGGTWLPPILPASWAPYIGLPLDQVLVGEDILAPEISVREDAGSDHLPVRVDFSVPPPARSDEDEPETQSVMLQ